VRVLATNGIQTVAAPAHAPSGGAADHSGAEFALRGTVDRTADALIASVDLASLRDGLVLWSTKAKAGTAQSANIAEQLSANVGWVLRCALDLRAGADPSIEMFGNYLRVCGMFRQDIEQTPELTHRLVEIAPQYANSHWLDAFSNAFVSTTPMSTGAKRPPDELARLRKIVYESADRAKAIDPRFDPKFARAIVADPAVGLGQREKMLQQSILGEGESIAGPVYALFQHGVLLESVGRIRDAQVAIERAVKQDPLDMQFRSEAAFIAGWLGNMEVARRAIDDVREKVIATAGLDSLRLSTELWFGDPALARSVAEQRDEASWRATGDRTCWTAIVEAANAGTPLSEAQIEAVCPGSGITIYTYFGHVDAAFRIYDERLQMRGPPDVIDAN
jgi:hypothetical protein